MMSSVSEMYSIVVIWLFWAWYSFCVACIFWLPGHITKKLWILANLCNILSWASFFNSKSFAGSVISNAGLSPANVPLVARASYLRTNFMWRVSPGVFDCLQPITSHTSENLTSTVRPCGMIENMSHSTLEKSIYFECISSCCNNQLTIVLATGSDSWPTVRVWTGKTFQFGSRPAQKPDRLLLCGANPYLYTSILGFCQDWLDPSVLISGSHFRVFLFRVAFRYLTLKSKISTLVHHCLCLLYWLHL